MEFYTAWWPGDPRYHFYDQNSYFLINITSVSNSWNIKKMSRENLTRPWLYNQEFLYPNKVIVSSGKPDNRAKRKIITIEETLKRQIELINDLDFEECLFLHPDTPVPLKKGKKGIKEKFDLNIKNAEKYLENTENGNISGFISIVGVVHGNNAKSLENCANQLIDFGYKYLALGNREFISKYDRKGIADSIQAIIRKNVKVHVLGVSSFDLFSRFPELCSLVNSIDSSTPIMEGKNVGIYFNHINTPLKGIIRFKVCTPKLWPPIAKTPWLSRYGFAGLICAPINWPEKKCSEICSKFKKLKARILFDLDKIDCTCSNCLNHGVEGILTVRKEGQKILNNRRAIHNIYHMKMELSNILKKNGGKLMNPFKPREIKIAPP